MFFRKTKLIKELTLKNLELRRENAELRAIMAKPPVKVEITPRKIETFSIERMISADISEKFRNELVARYLADELVHSCPYVSISSKYDPMSKCFITRATIDVLVKE